jgi:hypothetical protein
MTNEEFIESVRLEGEEWKSIPGMEGFYMASTEGRIISLGRYVLTKNGAYRYKRPKLQLLTVNNNGYPEVRISIEGKRRTFAVHRLIGKTFIPNTENKPSLDHIDRVRTNNRVSNLRWCTLSENMKNPLTLAYIKQLEIKRDHSSHCKPVVCLKDNCIVKQYKSLIETEQDGFVWNQVYLACSGRTKSHRGFKWMYLSDYKSLVSKSKNA